MKIYKRICSTVLVFILIFTSLPASFIRSSSIQQVNAEGTPLWEVGYEDFTNTDNLQLNGDSLIVDNKIYFESGDGSGESVFTKDTISLGDDRSFSTAFTFNHTDPISPFVDTNGGFTFTLQSLANNQVANDYQHDSIAPSLSISFTGSYRDGATTMSYQPPRAKKVSLLGNVRFMESLNKQCDIIASPYLNGDYANSLVQWNLHTYNVGEIGANEYKVWIGYDGVEKLLTVLLLTPSQDYEYYKEYMNLSDTLTTGEVYAGFMGSLGNAVTASEISSWYFSSGTNLIDEALVEADKIWLDTEIEASHGITNPLPLYGKYESNISWTSSNTDLVKEDGTVIFPTLEQGDQTIIVTATITKGGAVRVAGPYTVTIKVPALIVVEADKVWLTDSVIKKDNESLDTVISELALPTEGMFGSDIIWFSDNTVIIDTNGNVNRPAYAEGDQTVLLTAIIENGGYSVDKTFNMIVKALGMSDQEMVNADYTWLSNSILRKENLDINQVTTDINLPVLGQYGSTIHWESENELLINIDGTVTRPTYQEGNQTISLIATIDYGIEQRTKAILVTVLASDMMESDQLDLDLLWLNDDVIRKDNSAIDHTTSNLNLPEVSNLGSVISWESDNTDLVSTDGFVNRPTNSQGSKIVTLTATLTRGSLSLQKKFTITVIALEPSEEEKIALDKEWLTAAQIQGDNSSINHIINAMNLVTKGPLGSDITWSSTNNLIILSTNGNVTRPHYLNGNQLVTLTATIRNGAFSETKEFSVTVIALEQTAEAKLEEDFLWLLTDESLLNGNTDYFNITTDLNLPIVGPRGSTIVWESNQAIYIESGGKVSRPTYVVGDQYVTLTASLYNGLASNTVTRQFKVIALPITDIDSVHSDLQWLTNNFTSEVDIITNDLVLPQTGLNGTTITWISSDTPVISNDGKITRPGYSQGDKRITLIATVSKGNVSEEKTFTVTVGRLDMTAKEVREADHNWLKSYNILMQNKSQYSVTSYLSFPRFGPNGAEIIWKSSKPLIISDQGMVSRPNYGKGSEVVTMTAYIYKEESIIVPFTFTVLEKPDLQDPTVINTSPENHSQEVLWDTNKIVITYNEPIIKGSELARDLGIELNSTKSPGFAATIDHNKIILELYNDLSPGENRIYIPSGAVTDKTGNKAEAYELTFQVEKKVIRTIEAKSPVPSKFNNNVPLDIPQVSFNFDSLEIRKEEAFETILLRSQSGRTVAATVSLKNSLVTLDLKEPLEGGTLYEIFVPAGAVQDRFENSNLEQVFQFRTKEIPPIINKVIHVYPSNKWKNVYPGIHLTVSFEQEMKLEDCKLELINKKTNTTHPFHIVTNGYRSFRLIPEEKLDPNTQYSLSGPYYSSSNTTRPEFYMEFTTALNTDLQIISTSRARDVLGNENIKIHFASNILAGSNMKQVKLLDYNREEIAYTVIIQGNTAIIDPVELLESRRTYFLSLPDEAFMDQSKQNANYRYWFQFTTAGKIVIPDSTLEIPSNWFVEKEVPITIHNMYEVLFYSGYSGREIISYEWEFGDGTILPGTNPKHSYASPGSYEIKLKMIDNAGFKYEMIRTITIKAITNPELSVQRRGNNYLYMPIDISTNPDPHIDYLVSLTQDGKNISGERIHVELYKQGKLVESYNDLTAKAGDKEYKFTYYPTRTENCIYELVFTYEGSNGKQVDRQTIQIDNRSDNPLRFRLYDNNGEYYEDADLFNIVVNGQKTKALKEWQEDLGYYAYVAMLPYASYKTHSIEIEGWSTNTKTIYIGGKGSLPVTILGAPIKPGITALTYTDRHGTPIDSSSDVLFEKNNQYVEIQGRGNWNELEPGYIEFKTLQGRAIRKTYLGEGMDSFTTSLNIGYGGIMAGEQLIARMVTKNGTTSEWKYLPTIKILPLPTIMGVQLEVQGTPGNYEVLWPTKFEEILGDSISFLDDVPYLDGGNFGLGSDMPYFQGFMNMTDGTLTFDLDIGTTDFIFGSSKKNKKDTKYKQVKKITAVGYNFSISVEGGLTFEYQFNSGKWNLKRLVIDVDGYAGKNWTAGYTIGGVIGIQGTIELGVGVGGTLIIDKDNSGTNYSGIIRITPELDATVLGSYGVGAITGNVNAKVPAEIHFPTYYIGAGVNVTSKITASFIGYETTLYEEDLVNLHWDNGKEKVLLKSMDSSMNRVITEYSGLELKPRDSSTSQFQWYGGEDDLLMKHVYSKAEFQLTQDGSQQWLVWTDDNQTRDVWNRTELRYSVLTDGQWSTPKWIGNDKTADFTPSVASTGEGVLMAWQNISKEVSEEDGLEARIRNSEISVTKDVFTSHNSKPTIITLTNDSKLDHSPILAGGNDKGLLVWTKSEGLGFSFGPDMEEYLAPKYSDQLFFSVWEDGAWSTPEQIQGSLPTVLDSNLTMYEDTGVLLYTLDMDNEASTKEDREVFARVYNGVTWGEEIQLSNDTLSDASPKAINVGGEWFITWIRDGSIVYKNGIDGEVIATDFLENIQSGYELLVTEGPRPIVTLIYQKPSKDKTQGISTVFYDWNQEQWGKENTLVGADEYVGSFDATLEEDGSLAVAYSQASVTRELAPKTLGGVEELVEKLSISNQVDIKRLNYSPVHDLALEDRLYLSTEAPMPGTVTTVYATIKNNGDFAEEVILQLYEGNPTEGGRKIGRTTISDPIPARSNYEAEIEWIVGLEEKDQYEIYAVVLSGSDQIESNKDNNMLSLQVSSSDISLTSLIYENLVRDDYYVTAKVVNSGSKTLDNITLTIMNETTKEILAKIPVEKLKPNQETMISRIITTKGLSNNGRINIIGQLTLPEGIQESFIENNSRALSMKPNSFLIEGVNPGPYEEQVDILTPFTFSFNMEIEEGTGFHLITLRDNKLNEIVIQKEINKNILTIIPESPLEYGTDYTITIPVDALSDAYNHRMEDEYKLSFTTTIRNPRLLVAYPGNGMVDVAKNTDITLRYNQSIVAGKEFSNIILYGPKSEKIPITVTIKDEILMIDHMGQLQENTSYYLEVPIRAVQNQKGEIQLDDYMVGFKTALDDEEVDKDVDTSNEENGERIINIVIGGIQRSITVATTNNDSEINLEHIAADLFSSGEEIEIDLTSISSRDAYTLIIPANTLESVHEGSSLIMKTTIGTIVIPSGLLSGMSEASELEGKIVTITIGDGDSAILTEEVREAAGNHPILQITMTFEGEHMNWNNPTIPLEVSIPYLPTVEELDHPECIVIWYIDEKGNITPIPNGQYSDQSKTVNFKTTHASNFAVAYNKVKFGDVPEGAWYSKGIAFIAAREITAGTEKGKFSPKSILTRGQFITMMMRAYGIEPGTSLEDNFADAGDTWYTGYLATAKELGISAGVGKNLFVPEKEITRQEMVTLLYNVLRVMNQLPVRSSKTNNLDTGLAKFIDEGQIASWAREAMIILTEAGIINGNDGKLSPMSSASRAEMAQVLYYLLLK